MSYWQKIGKRFSIKIAFPHLFLGVIAATLSLSSQASLPANIQTTNIIAIASVIVNLHETAAESKIQLIHPQTFDITKIDLIIGSFSAYFAPAKPIRLTPNNGIRAGPSLSLIV